MEETKRRRWKRHHVSEPCLSIDVISRPKFTEGYDGRCSGYTIEKQNVKTGEWERVTSFVPDTATEAVVPKLKEGESYKFRVMAENSQGLSKPLETEKATKAKNPYGNIKNIFVTSRRTRSRLSGCLLMWVSFQNDLHPRANRK